MLGTHTKLINQRKQILKREEEKLLYAEIWKTYQLSMIEKLYEYEKKLIEKELENSKNLLRDKMIQDRSSYIFLLVLYVYS